MKKNILFIVPPHISYNDYINPLKNGKQVKKKDGKYYGNLITDAPLGILSLSSYIKKYVDIEVYLLDFNIVLNSLDGFEFESYDEVFRDKLEEYANNNFEPYLIGISSLFTASYESFISISNISRELFSKSLIIGGGTLATNLYKEIYNEVSSVDALCFGEGELPLRSLLSSENPLNIINEHNSWITKEKIDNNCIFEHSFIENLDEIPFLDYALVDKDYSLNPAFASFASNNNTFDSFYVMTSRGCPFKCVFCASHKVHGRDMRYNSIPRVKEDLLKLKNEYGAKTLVFQDDHLMGDKKRAYEIIEFVGQLGVKVIFQNSLALYALDRKMLEAIRATNTDQLVLSVESGSERVLKEVMKKPLKLSIIERVVKDCRELGLYSYVNILIGLPGETKDDIEDTRKFLKNLGANWYAIYVAAPLVGSEMFEICEENGFLVDNYLETDYKKALVSTDDFSAEYILKMTYFLNLELNFAENTDYKLGNYQEALLAFERVINSKEDHALAYYCAWKCCKKLKLEEKEKEYYNLLNKYGELPIWKDYFKQLNIKY